jgi:hypothetical protein
MTSIDNFRKIFIVHDISGEKLKDVPLNEFTCSISLKSMGKSHIITIEP